jgi:hypothetical protein
VSGVLAAGETQPGRNIPEELRGLGVPFARLMVGAAMAVFLLALWRFAFSTDWRWRAMVGVPGRSGIRGRIFGAFCTRCAREVRKMSR